MPRSACVGVTARQAQESESVVGHAHVQNKGPTVSLCLRPGHHSSDVGPLDLVLVGGAVLVMEVDPVLRLSQIAWRRTGWVCR
jgi:hypothetical protein